MDEVFGSGNVISEIVLRTTSGAGSPSGGTDTLAGVHDYAIWYARNREFVKYRQLYLSKDLDNGGSLYRRVRLADGRERPATAAELAAPRTLPQGARLFLPDNLTSQSSPESATFAVEIEGHTFVLEKADGRPIPQVWLG